MPTTVWARHKKRYTCTAFSSFEQAQGAQETHLSMVAVELLGVGIAPRHHRRLLGDADVGLPQSHAVAAGQVIEARDRGMEKLGVGREGDVLGLNRGVDRDPRQVSGAQRAACVCHPQALGQQ
jgi:hypothetical protein